MRSSYDLLTLDLFEFKFKCVLSISMRTAIGQMQRNTGGALLNQCELKSIQQLLFDHKLGTRHSPSLGEYNKLDVEAILTKLQPCKFQDNHDPLGKSNDQSGNEHFIIMRKQLILGRCLFINYPWT